MIKRGDDTADVIHRRIHSYHEETKPLLDYYAKKRIHATVIDAKSGRLADVSAPMPVVRWSVTHGLWDSAELVGDVCKAVGGEMSHGMAGTREMEEARRELWDVRRMLKENKERQRESERENNDTTEQQQESK